MAMRCGGKTDFGASMASIESIVRDYGFLMSPFYSSSVKLLRFLPTELVSSIFFNPSEFMESSLGSSAKDFFLAGGGLTS